MKQATMLTLQCSSKPPLSSLISHFTLSEAKGKQKGCSPTRACFETVITNKERNTTVWAKKKKE